jgi:hypothetical protein
VTIDNNVVFDNAWYSPEIKDGQIFANNSSGLLIAE